MISPDSWHSHGNVLLWMNHERSPLQMLSFIYLPEHFLSKNILIIFFQSVIFSDFIWIYMIVLGRKLMWLKMWPLVNIIPLFFFFFSPESTCGVQMCVHCQSDDYKSPSRSEQASRGSRCSYVGLFFPWEPHRSCNQGCVLYWTGKHAARSGSGPKQHTTSINLHRVRPTCGLRFCPNRVLESRLLSSICRV